MNKAKLIAFIAANGCLPQEACVPRSQPCVDGVSSQTSMLARAANRTAYYVPGVVPLAALAAGAESSGFAAVAGFTNTLTVAMWRSIYITDITAPLGGTGLASLDDVRFNVYVSGFLRMTFNGGRFARGNANECVTACGIVVCAGPQEAVLITATNTTAAALGATATATVETRTVYSGEKGFTCAEDGSCSPVNPEFCESEVG